MITFFIILIILIILLIKFHVSVVFVYSNESKRAYFSIILFKKFTLISGYITKRMHGGLYLHLKNKAIILNLKNIEFLNGGGNIKKYITLLSFDLDVVTGYESLSKIFITHTLLQTLNVVLNAITHSKNSKIETSTDIDFNSQDRLDVLLVISISFCLFGILLGIIANIVNKGYKYAKKQIAK